MIYHAEMEGRVVKQWFVMGSACRFMALAGLLCLALLLSGCGTTYISAPDYGGRYDTSSLGARVAQTARSQIGAHYRLGGTTPKGFDCSGLIWWGLSSAWDQCPPRDRCAGQGRVRRGAGHCPCVPATSLSSIPIAGARGSIPHCTRATGGSCTAPPAASVSVRTVWLRNTGRSGLSAFGEL